MVGVRSVKRSKEGVGEHEQRLRTTNLKMEEEEGTPVVENKKAEEGIFIYCYSTTNEVEE